MTPEEHRARHVLLHQAFDELLADWMACTDRPHGGSWLDRPISELLTWSNEQTTNPTRVIPHEDGPYEAS